MLNPVHRLGRGLCLLLAAGLLAPAWADPLPAPPPAASLFKPGALDFEPTSGKVLGLYVANWEAPSRVAEIGRAHV